MGAEHAAEEQGHQVLHEAEARRVRGHAELLLEDPWVEVPGLLEDLLVAHGAHCVAGHQLADLLLVELKEALVVVGLEVDLHLLLVELLVDRAGGRLEGVVVLQEGRRVDPVAELLQVGLLQVLREGLEEADHEAGRLQDLQEGQRVVVRGEVLLLAQSLVVRMVAP